MQCNGLIAFPSEFWSYPQALRQAPAHVMQKTNTSRIPVTAALLSESSILPFAHRTIYYAAKHNSYMGTVVFDLVEHRL